MRRHPGALLHLAAACCALLLAPAALAADSVVVSEVLADPAPTSLASPVEAQPSDWAELHNLGPAPANLGGWTLIAGAGRGAERFELPPVELPAGGFLVITEGGDLRAAPGAPAPQVVAGPGGIALLPIPDFKIGREGEALSLLRPDGSEAYTTGAVPRSALAADDVVISEVVADPASASSGALASPATGEPSDWAELHNLGPAPANLGGWVLVAGEPGARGADRFELPPVELPAGGFLVITEAADGAAAPQAADGPGGARLLPLPGFAVSRRGERLSLLRPDGSTAYTTGEVVAQQEGVSFGLPAGAPPGAAPTFLLRPTPGAANSAAKPSGPLIYSTARTPDGYTPPGASLTITARVGPGGPGGAVAGVTLLWRVNYGPEQRTPMAPAPEGADATGGPGAAYAVTIPATAFREGDMVRWAVEAAAAGGAPGGGASRAPDPLADEGEYEGTVIAGPPRPGALPILYWWVSRLRRFSQDPVAAQSQAGGVSSVSFGGRFYDAVGSERRGVTSLAYPKPKMTFRANGGREFELFADAPRYGELKLNSLYYEIPGENSFMKEVVATKVMAEEGLMAPLSYHIEVLINGQYAGLYSVVEEVDNEMIERNGLPSGGPIFKSVSGELSNLRWDLPLGELPNYYGKSNRRRHSEDWALLANLARGLAGGTDVPRSRFLFDALDLPSVINEMAIQTLLNHMDRCTKNFYLWLSPETQTWRTIPWDLEASLGQDNGLGGSPGPLYCVLACEQWNSPLYCDSEHPQDLEDLEVKTAWGTTTVVGLNTYFGPAKGAAGSSAPAASGRRRLRQGGRLRAEGNPDQLTWPEPRGWDDPDRVTYGTPSTNGAAGTYNHLIDAVLDVNATRAMYMRRLRTLADKYYGEQPDNGRLRQIIDDTWGTIREAAARDNQRWGRGDGTRGYTQLTTEFIPVRARQLLQLYAPGGRRPLLPGPQDPSRASASVSRVEAGGPEGERFIQITSGVSDEAVDVGGWTITNGSESWALPPGTVLPPGGSAFLSASPPAFRGRAASPRGGEGLLVLHAPARLLAAAAAGPNGWSVSAAPAAGGGAA
ncbi:MAG: coth protein-domain-containing protein [Monoraphidium minutum]|nr:MAG: coth protein-domain-containing protein [Monoraphidium minutum]